MPLKFVRNDITLMKVDAIVNAANAELREGGGVCGAIFQAAGSRELGAECATLAPCGVGQAVLTNGYALPARHIIHTVGPVWQGGTVGEEARLRDCYTGSLRLAVQHKLKSIAFPLISSGIFGYPKEQAMRVAVSAIRDFLRDHDLLVYLVFFDAEADLIGEQRYRDITRYIDDHYVKTHFQPRGSRTGRNQNLPTPYDAMRIQESADMLAYDKAPAPSSAPTMGADEAPRGSTLKGASTGTLKRTLKRRSLQDVVSQLEESFSESLLRLIDEKGLTDVETYKRANVDRRLFSKIRGDKAHTPKKATALAFAIALRLSLDETQDLLGKAGYALSSSSRFDVIVAYCLEDGMYDIDAVNEVLFEFKEPLLGA